MSQYFQNDVSVKSELHTIKFDFDGQKFALKSDNGVFSKDRLDTGTEILLKTVLEQSQPQKDVLDLGCGIGTVGVILSRFWNCQVTGIEINDRAARLAEENYKMNHVNGEVYNQDGLQEMDTRYDCILLNPPIRAGKAVIYSLFEQSAKVLKPDGNLWIVMRKQHGAASAIDYLKTLGLDTERCARDKGFWIIKANL